MKILFSAVPGFGHTFPLLPLARAFARRGDEVGFLTAANLAGVVTAEGFDHLAAGPPPEVLFAESTRRSGGDAAAGEVAGVADFFGGTRLDLAGGEALRLAERWRPDVIVNELFDLVGVLAARALDAPLATVSTGPAAPPEILAAIAASAAPHFAARGLAEPTGLPAGRWLLETCPEALGPLPVADRVERWTLQPEAHRGTGGAAGPVAASDAGPTGRPRVLVTFGSHFAAPAVVGALLDDLAGSSDLLDVDLVGTALPGADPHVVPHRSDRVSVVPFQPLEQLLRGTAAVVTHGGAGTVLGTLTHGLPVVVVPQGADQFLQAAAVTRAGCGLATAPGRPDPDELSAAVRTVLQDPAYAAAAVDVQKQIAAMGTPAQVAEELVRAVAG